MIRKFIILLAAAPSFLQAQTGVGTYKYDESHELWNKDGNAAALAIDSARTRGVTYIGCGHSDATYHRVQQEALSNNLRFFSERYQPLGRYLYGYGKMAFDMDHYKGRAWSDVIRPYNSDPYFPASSRTASYDYWNIDLTASVGTAAFGAWRFGARLDYKIGDLTRLRDPRSRSELTDYSVAPAVAYTAGNSTVALSARYNRRKEKIPGVSMVSEFDYMYYQLSGLENAAGTLGGYSSYTREWVNQDFGARLSYGYRSDNFSDVSSIGIDRGSESVYGQYEYEPGHYYDYIYRFSSRNRLFKRNMIHEMDIAARYEQAYADEYRQTLSITTDSTTGYNSYHYLTQIEFRKRYQVKTMAVDFRYRANLVSRASVYGYIGIEGEVSKAENKHVLYDSRLKYGTADVTLQTGWNIRGILSNGLWVEAEIGCRKASDATLELSDDALELSEASTLYATSVLIPDMQYLNSDYARGLLRLTYQFPLTIKRHRSTWFVSAFAEGLHTNKPDGYDRHLNKTNIGLTIGLFN